MKIKRVSRKKETFGNLDFGDVFEYDEEIYMKIIESDGGVTGLNLDESNAMEFASPCEVIKVNATLEVEE